MYDDESYSGPIDLSFKFTLPANYDPDLEYKLRLGNQELFKFRGSSAFDGYEAGSEIIVAWPEASGYMEMIQQPFRDGEIQLNISNDNADADAQQTGGRKKNIKRKSHKRKSRKLKSKRRKRKSKSKRR
jgi:hypothetical protein